MKYFLDAAKLLLLDLASTLLFLILYLATKNLAVSVATAMALGLAQIGWQFLRKKPIDSMQWLSLFLVLGAGAATLITNDPHFVMLKPTVIYTVVGIVMLKPGWMNRYLPPIAMEVVPDVAVLFGFIWAALMFFSAALNLIVALNFSVVAWSAFMSIYGIVSKVAPSAQVEAEVTKLLATMTARSPRALVAVKDFLRSAPHMEPRGMADYGANLLAAVLSSAGK